MGRSFETNCTGWASTYGSFSWTKMVGGWSHSHWTGHWQLWLRAPHGKCLTWWTPCSQFNRCITSQMIKWFSNFREFYYIQMEKYARQAISDGVTNPKMLAVLRDSEIFRVLNTHYNKGNDFEVSQCTGSPEIWDVFSLNGWLSKNIPSGSNAGLCCNIYFLPSFSDNFCYF